MKEVNKNHSIWYEKYKPQCVDDMLLPDKIKDQIKGYIKTGNIPALGFFSPNPGLGKSSLCNAIARETGAEVLWVNASLERSIDTIRGRINSFATQASFDGSMRIVILDEFDHFSKDGQAAMRGFIDETSSSCAFIFTGNYKEKIIEPLLDRLNVIDFETFKKEEMIKPIFERLCFILENEGITFDKKSLVPVINTYYPRIRAMVGALQKFSKDGEFILNESELDDLNIFDEVMKEMSLKTYTGMITKVNTLNSPDNMYSFLYSNASKYFKPESYPSVVIIIAKYQHMSDSVRDKNLNLAACLTELLKFK